MANIDATTLKLANFNNAPGAEEASLILNDWNAGDWAEVADAEAEYWQNDEATIVLQINANLTAGVGLSFMAGFNFAKAVHELHPDEFDTMRENEKTYIRLWWD